MLKLVRSDATTTDFIGLVKLLDAELAIRDGDDHAFYNQYNGLDDIRHAVVVYLDNRPIGCGAIKQYDDTTMEVKRMYTHPDGRGKGIASTILKELEKWSHELSFVRCILETGKAQPEAINLYRKHSYIQIPNYGQYTGVDNSLCFEKKLEI